jgi:hypothetical protein
MVCQINECSVKERIQGHGAENDFFFLSGKKG